MAKSNRVLEQLARLEQRTTIRRGKFVDIMNTHAIHSLSHKEKKDFFNYVRTRKRAQRLLIGFLSFSLVFGIFLRPVISGNAIGSEYAGNLASTGLLAVFAVLFIGLIIYNIRNKKINAKFKSHIDIAEKAIHYTVVPKVDKLTDS